MRANPKKVLFIGAILVLAILLVWYVYFQGKNLLEGPRIEISTPVNGASFSDSLITLKGTAENVARISLNGRAIFVDKDGNFTESLLLLPGYNIINMNAEDKFGRMTHKTLELTLIN